MSDKAAAESAEAKPANSKKLILMIAGGVMLLVIVGVVLFLLRNTLFGHGEATTASHETPAKAAAKKAEPAAEEEEAPAPKKSSKKKRKSADVAGLVPLEPFTVNLQDPEGNRYMRLVLQLGLENAAGVKTAEEPIVKAKIRNAVLRFITTLTVEDVLSKEGKEKIVSTIIDRVNEALDEELVSDVFIIDLIVQ